MFMDYHNHPGGKKILQKYNNQDVTKIFNEIHRTDTKLESLLDKYFVTKLQNN